VSQRGSNHARSALHDGPRPCRSGVSKTWSHRRRSPSERASVFRVPEDAGIHWIARAARLNALKGPHRTFVWGTRVARRLAFALQLQAGIGLARKRGAARSADQARPVGSAGDGSRGGRAGRGTLKLTRGIAGARASTLPSKSDVFAAPSECAHGALGARGPRRGGHFLTQARRGGRVTLPREHA
jgi:hypothetical protein